MPIKKQDLMDIQMASSLVPIRRRSIQSSNIEWIGWPTDGTRTMIVHFSNGGRYAYIGVSRQRSMACAQAESSTNYLNKIIKPNYRVMKLR